MSELQTRPGADVLESVIIQGDLSKLSPEQRVRYYHEVCKSLGLNPLTRPFDYLSLNGKLVLYANKTASDQLRTINQISIDKPEIKFEDDWIIVTVGAHDGKGRSDSDVGVVSKKDMRGDFGNALMKAVTKAKRRVTLSICGLGWSDETEIETIPNARQVTVDSTTGEIKQEVAQIEASKQVEQAKTTDPHWATNQKTLAAWWPWVKSQGLTNVECHKALGVEHLAQYEGSETDARKAITDFITRNSAAYGARLRE